jgi:hypothetical protein
LANSSCLAAIRMKRTAYPYNLTNATIQRKTCVAEKFEPELQ